MFNTLTSPEIIKTTHKIDSDLLKRTIEFDIYYPQHIIGNEKLNLLLVNDGQDLAQMGLAESLKLLYKKWKISPTVIVGIKAGEERVQEYGVANKLDFKKRGSKAKLYTEFIIKKLLPYVEEEVKLPINGNRAIAGFSLGGISAFDIAWNNDSFFDKVGVFSGSFWWRKKDISATYTDNDRIVHEMIRQTPTQPNLKFWLMTGTEDEKADRNHNFIIDSIDDTIDIIKELSIKGYKRPQDIFYFEKVGGKHDIATWASVMPKFLEWAFAN